MILSLIKISSVTVQNVLYKMYYYTFGPSSWIKSYLVLIDRFENISEIIQYIQTKYNYHRQRRSRSVQWRVPG